MKYLIDEAVICGIKNPSLIIRGWVENSAEYLVVKKGNTVIKKQEIKKTRSRVSTFHYSIDLKGHTNVDIYFEGNGKLEKVTNISATLSQRIIKKYKPKGILINNLNNKLSNKNSSLKKELAEINDGLIDMKNSEEYSAWLAKHEEFEPTKEYSYQPKISIVMPVYNVPGEYLGYCLDSILNQTYQNFEICIADDCSTNEDTIETLKKYMSRDSRIKVVFREKNGHISRATNSALELATGEFVGLMDNDDKLEIHALNEVVNVLNKNPDIDFIYTDEDKIDMEENRSDPHFKSDFALDTLYGGNYICHFSVIRKSIIDKIGGFRTGYEGAQDFDLFLRITNETNKIYHIPKVLYHWRMIPGSTAVGGDGAKNYAALAGKKALEDYFEKKGIPVNIDNFISTHYFVEYLLEKEPAVDIIIYNYKENSKILKSIKSMTVYSNYNIICISSDDVNTVNETVKKSNSDYIVFVDGNTEFLTVDWLDILIGYASQDKIGVVGGKVLDENMLVREAGLIITDKPGLIPSTVLTYRGDYGYNGRLLVPFNYSIIECKLFAIKKDNFISLDTKFNLEYAFYDLNLALLDKGYRNVFVPQVEIMNLNASSKVNDEIIELLFEKNVSYTKKNDFYYNKNFSKEKAFKINGV
ncbi:glycosyltransferase [Erysipelatoclostridium sp. An173]|uniref:glycosyltransferase family 2 protein n=1 Tax=Erysipelatoclostridium sp. An173 TaxID=1965571 RepID=UPI000B3760AC|nr:glycosyltransferase [Erysipelatoclostridium sp. An173]OUP73983.1 glycosyltransferase [Erysipelatoclostridium sp. An173]